MQSYKPKEYWENRLTRKFDCSGVGHISFSESYNQWLYKAKLRTLTKAIREHNINLRQASVCDVGCGTGFFVNFYHIQEVEHVTGIDITNISIEKLKKQYPDYEFITADVAAPTLPEVIRRRFDIVNAFDVLYHLTDDNLFRQAIANMAHFTNPGGHILITDKFGAETVDAAQHVRQRSWKTYEKVFADYAIKGLAQYPLYYLLNRAIFGSLLGRIHSNMASALDNILAPVYYSLDKILLSERNSNLNLVLAKKLT